MEFDENGQPAPLKKRWKVAIPIPIHVDQELSEFSALFRQLLFNRGIDTVEAARAFVNCTTPFSTDPFYIKDMDIAVERLHNAIITGEKIAIYGDYDADGVTASALMIEFLKACWVTPISYIPNRFNEGYGLNMDAIDSLASQGVNLIITVDCGVRSVAEIQHAHDLGMSMIITDHHLPGAEPLAADAIINPKQPGDFYPEKMLAGVGLAYKLVQGYLTRYPVEGVEAEHWLDLVAIGTVADLAPIAGENRMLIDGGLKKIRSCSRQGLFSLAQVSGMDLAKTDTGKIGFVLGPRLNAAGRIDSAEMALDLLMTQDFLKAGLLAQQIEQQNDQRQALTREIQARAIDLALEGDPNTPIIFATSPDFSEGVVGLAASRIVEMYYRPAVVGRQDETTTVASCRSIPQFNITAALDQCEDLLVRYGGHAAAAGFTVTNENLAKLYERLSSIAKEQFANADLTPELEIDREIMLENVTQKYVPGILSDIAALQPTGRGNPDALFCSRNCRVVSARQVGSESTHLKMTIQAGSQIFDTIAFRQGYWYNDLPELVDIAYTFEINSYMGRQNLQLNIKDIQPAGAH